MTTPTITEREILNSILDGTFDIEVLKGYAEKKIAQLDKRNESAKKRAAKKRAEADILMEQVFGVLSEEPMSRTDVLEALSDIEGLTLGKVSYRLAALVREGRAIKQEAMIAEDGKAKKITVYSLA